MSFDKLSYQKDDAQSLPKGWEIKDFIDVCTLVGGSQPSKDYFIYEPKEGYIRLIQVRDYRTDKYITFIPKEKAKRFCSKDDIMIGRYGPPIFGIFKGLEGAYNVALMKAVVNEKICTKDYFYLFLQTDSIRKFVEHSSKRAAGQDGVRKELLDKYPIPLPPLPEQQRIVSILDQAFAAIDKAKANAEQNLQNAKELFESYLQGVFDPSTCSGQGVDDGWEKKRLEEVFDIGSSKRIMEKDWTVDGVPFYGGKEIVKLAKKGYAESNSYISEEKYNEYASKYDMPKQGDILITARGTIGIGYIVKKGDKFYYKDGNIISMRAKMPTNPEFILYALKSNAINDQLGKLTGATVSHLPISKAKKLVLMIPNFSTQNNVVEQIQKIEAETQKLEAVYQKKMDDLEELKKSILQKAFRGELVEPAGELTQTKHYDLHDESLSLAAEPKSKMQKQNG